MAIKKGGVLLLAGAALVVGAVLVNKYNKSPKKAKESVAINQITLPDAEEASLVNGNAVKLAFPSSEVSVNGGTKINWQVMTWNSQFGLMYANGGRQTTKESLLDKAKVQVQLNKQNDCNMSVAELVKFAQDVKDKGTNIPGVFCSYMGDGLPGFGADLAIKLKELGPDYQPVAFCWMGRSDGEDQLMGPLEWKRNPRAAIGKTVACFLRDGDMNILLKWASDNDSLKINPDERTYDPNAINLIAASDFVDAGNKYISGYTEPRKVVKNGKTTGETITVGVDAVATWTPVDVTIAEKKGGLVTIASTKKYNTQMPNTTITIKKWAEAHRADIKNIIVALAQGGDQVRTFTEAKEFAAQVSAKVYNEKDAKFWLTYYNGKEQKDKQGLTVQLGGSRAFNLVDAANIVGLGPDGLDRYKIVYTTFGDILSGMYPEIMKTYPKYEDIVDKSYLAEVIAEHPELMEGKALENKYVDEIVEETSSKSYAIQFDLGSDKIKSSSFADLDKIFKSAAIAEGLTVGVYGHTDNTGDDVINIPLSERRANAVREYLKNKGLRNKILVKGYGSTDPVEGLDPNSKAGRDANRRVEIVLGN